MSNIKQLDPIIRSLEKKSQLNEDEELVLIEEKGMFGFKKKKYFAVSNINQVDAKGISYKLTNGITILIPFRVSCPTGMEQKAVESLYQKNKTFAVSLNRKLKQWLHLFIQENGESSVLKNKGALKKFLIQKAFNEIGLTITPTIKPKDEDKLNEHPISKNISVRVNDFDEKLVLTLETDLLIDESRHDVALLGHEKLEDIQKVFRRVVKKEINSKFSLHEFCTALDTSVKEALIVVLNENLKPYGRHITHLKLHSSNIANILPIIDPVEIIHAGLYSIADYKQEVTVKNQLVLKLFNIGLLKKSKIENVETWLKIKVIPELVRDVLFEQNYKNVLLKLDDLKEQIKKDIKGRLEAVGYHVKQHAFLPELPELILIKEGFDDSSIDQEFVTSNSGVNISIQVTYKGRIGDLAALEDRLLLPNVNIESEMQDSVRGAVAEVIHVVDPERAYLGFENLYEGHRTTVKEDLIAAVKKVLVKKYKAETHSLKVFVKQTSSEVTKKAEALTSTTHSLKTKITPRKKSKYVEPVNYSVRFSIISVLTNGWPTFQKYIKRSSTDEIEEIKTILSENMQSELESVSYEIHLSGDSEKNKAFSQVLQERILPRIGELVGLKLHLVSLNRESTQLEEDAQNTRLALGQEEEKSNRHLKKKELESRGKSVELLLEKKKNLLEEGEYEEAEEVEEQIAKLKSEFSYNRIQQLNDRSERKLLLEEDSEPSLEDELKNLTQGLLGGNDTDHLKESSDND